MTRPNIALFIADDIPRNMLGAYGAKHGLSPNLDALAASGAVFERAYTTAPLCTPSRFSLLTGLYASNSSSITAHRPWSLVGFNTFLTGKEPTVAHRLTRIGYLTGFVGKYHIGFPLPKAQQRKGREFGGSGRGLNYQQMAEVVRKYGGFERVPAVWGGNKQTAQSPHNPEWMTAKAIEFVREAAGSGKPFFLYFAGTVPHAPFGMPSSFEVNVTQTPAGPVPYEPAWEARRGRLRAKLTALGLVCKDYRQCHRKQYEGADGVSSEAYRRPLAISDPWLHADWLYTEPNFEQARLARLFVSGLAWLDDSIGGVLDELRVSGLEQTTLAVYAADHGASFLGKGARWAIRTRWRKAQLAKATEWVWVGLVCMRLRRGSRQGRILSMWILGMRGLHLADGRPHQPICVVSRASQATFTNLECACRSSCAGRAPRVDPAQGPAAGLACR